MCGVLSPAVPKGEPRSSAITKTMFGLRAIPVVISILVQRASGAPLRLAAVTYLFCAGLWAQAQQHPPPRRTCGTALWERSSFRKATLSQRACADLIRMG